MNIVLINDLGVECYSTWREVSKYTTFRKEDFTKVGPDYVLNCNNETYEVSKDIKLLERVASDRVFAKTKANNIDWLVIGTFCLVLFSLIK